MQNQGSMQSGAYENVRVLIPEAPIEEMAAGSAQPQYGPPAQTHIGTYGAVPAADHQYMAAGNAPVAVAPVASVAPPAPAVSSAAAEPMPGTGQASVEMVRWREDLQVTASPQERVVGTVKVRKYVTVEDFTGTIPIEYETVQVIREPVSVEEAALLTPADIAELTQEVELHTQEAVVTRRMVPIERVRLQISRVKGEATINDMLRSEHFEVEEPSVPPNLQDAVRRIDAPYDGRIDYGQVGPQGSEQTKQAESRRRFGRRGQ